MPKDFESNRTMQKPLSGIPKLLSREMLLLKGFLELTMKKDLESNRTMQKPLNGTPKLLSGETLIPVSYTHLTLPTKRIV